MDKCLASDKSSLSTLQNSFVGSFGLSTYLWIYIFVVDLTNICAPVKNSVSDKRMNNQEWKATEGLRWTLADFLTCVAVRVRMPVLPLLFLSEEYKLQPRENRLSPHLLALPAVTNVISRTHPTPDTKTTPTIPWIVRLLFALRYVLDGLMAVWMHGRCWWHPNEAISYLLHFQYSYVVSVGLMSCLLATKKRNKETCKINYLVCAYHVHIKVHLWATWHWVLATLQLTSTRKGSEIMSPLSSFVIPQFHCPIGLNSFLPICSHNSV